LSANPDVERPVLEYSILLLFPAAMLVGGMMDMLTLTIPNKISALLIAAFFAAAAVTGMSLTLVGVHLATGFVVLAIGFLLFAGGYIGGGDAKLLAAGALWFGHNDVLSYIICVAIAGGLLSVSMLLYRAIILPPFLMRQDWALRLHNKKAGIPYGVALAAAALWVFPSTAWFINAAA
jgi:prepilin peptidase CpaA